MSAIKNFIKHYYFSFRDLLIPSYPSQKLEKSLVILRMDAIGDYILFRNFIEIIKTSDKYKDFSITLIGNKIWKPIAEELDNEWVDRFIWVDLRSFHKKLSYRKSALKEIEDRNYAILFHPSYSREHFISEVIAKRVNAKIKVASIGDISNTTKWQKRLTDKTYSRLIETPKNLQFEFHINKAIVESFIDKKSEINKPIIRININQELLIKDSIILFIGGNIEFRKWGYKNWIQLIQSLLSKTTQNIVLAGGPSDIEESKLISDKFNNNDRVLNYCGSTSLIELIQLISNSKFLVSNESSAPHIAAALGIPVVVVSNGNHYGRFNPYPKELDVNYQIAYPSIIEDEKDENKLIKDYSSGSNLAIKDIQLEQVLSKIDKLNID